MRTTKWRYILYDEWTKNENLTEEKNSFADIFRQFEKTVETITTVKLNVHLINWQIRENEGIRGQTNKYFSKYVMEKPTCLIYFLFHKICKIYREHRFFLCLLTRSEIKIIRNRIFEVSFSFYHSLFLSSALKILTFNAIKFFVAKTTFCQFLEKWILTYFSD